MENNPKAQNTDTQAGKNPTEIPPALVSDVKELSKDANRTGGDAQNPSKDRPQEGLEKKAETKIN